MRRAVFSFVMISVVSLTVIAQVAPAEQQPGLPVLSKTPKSLFLIKKAKIDNDVGEPVLYPSEKQSKLLTDEKIFNKYRLQILDGQKDDWGNTR
ncbi:MAG: hypothetical protein V4596_05590 [Bdellovibrionota bacterium]